MTLQGVPWFMGHTGAVHPPEIQRLLAYVASGGAEGIVAGIDLKVAAQGSPAASVAIGGGGAVILNRYAGGDSQSYVARNAGSETLAVPNTAGTGRTDLVVIRVDDDQYGGAAPVSPANGPYVRFFLIQNVASTVKTAAELNLGYPAVALARITQPSSNTTVTNAMITDLRQVATPRQYTKTFTVNPSVTEPLTSTAADGVAFPAASAAWTVDIPSWATKCIVRGDWSLGAPTGNSLGILWVRLGLLAGTHVDTQTDFYNTNNASNGRESHYVVDTVAVPAGLRGTTAALSMRGKMTSATPAGARVQVDTAGGEALTLTFVEEAA